MSKLAAIVMLGICGALGAAYLAQGVLVRRKYERDRTPIAEPRSLVRVLRSEAEIEEAVERAVAHEQEVARVVTWRIDRYRQASHTAPVLSLSRLVPSDSTPVEQTSPLLRAPGTRPDRAAAGRTRATLEGGARHAAQVLST